MFSLDFFVCQFRACLFASVFTCVPLLTYPRAVVWLLCVSLSVCECVHLCSYACVWVCVPVRVRACVRLCCLFIWLSSSVFSVASPYLPCSPPPIPRCLPPPRRSITCRCRYREAQVGAADTSLLWSSRADTRSYLGILLSITLQHQYNMQWNVLYYYSELDIAATLAAW